MAKSLPTLHVADRELLLGDSLILSGEGWDRSIVLEIDGTSYRELRPNATGAIHVVIPTDGFTLGPHEISTREPQIAIDVVIAAPEKLSGPRRRAADNARRRFGSMGFAREGLRLEQVANVRALRDKILRNPPRRGTPGIDIGPPGVIRQPLLAPCEWTLVGASPVREERPRRKKHANVMSGQVKCIAIHPKNGSIVYIGTHQGGVWKTTDAGASWRPLTDDRMTLNITALAIDPNNPSRVYAGTDGGILRSENDGATWAELGLTRFGNATIKRILFDLTDTSQRRMILGATNGVHESALGDDMWTEINGTTGVSDFVLIPTGAGNVRLVAGRPGGGLFTIDRTAAVWGTWTAVFDNPAMPALPPTGTFDRIALGQCRDKPLEVYAIFGARFSRKTAGICRSHDAGTTWDFVTPPMSRQLPATSGSAEGHTHRFYLSKATFDTGAEITATTESAAGHTHTVPLSAEEIVKLRDGRALQKTTDSTTPDGGTAHAHELVLCRAEGFQTDYNLHISVHPSDPDVVYFGEVMLWKRDVADAAWKMIDAGRFRHHVDQHAFAFDPEDAETIWIGNDGGIFRSTDGGKSWGHRNETLATLMYNRVAQHPLWETVLLGGTQDNGVQRAGGHLAWDFSAGSDAGFVGIDSEIPTCMFSGYIENSVQRSDKAAATNSWVNKLGSISGKPVEFYPPFAVDPSKPGTSFFGNSRLWRTPDRAETWKEVSSDLGQAITAIAVHPKDSTTVVVGTTGGKIVRIRGNDADWSGFAETSLDTGIPLPRGAVRGLCIDSAGTVWAAFDTLDGAGKSVFRLQPGSTTWEVRSTGLPINNPAFALAIDPTNDSRLFCGFSLGLFKTEDAGASWTAWDQGLPNSEVRDLVVHQERRLLRAATYGRSVWERPIDAIECPAADLYLRDNILDSGRVTPSPNGEPHPFSPETEPPIDWNHSPDIKVDAPVGVWQATSGTMISSLEFEEFHESHPSRGSVNRLFVQVHNRGPAPATRVKVRAFYSNTVGDSRPPLPDDFWTGSRPFDEDPDATNWIPVGDTIAIDSLLPGDHVVEWDWELPGNAMKNFSILAVTSCDEDPASGGATALADAIRENKHLAVKEVVAPWLAVICNWAERSQLVCTEWAARDYEQCAEWRDDGYTSCTEQCEDRVAQCDNVFCTAFFWVVSWVCVAWTWITNVVCVAWVWIREFVCVVFTWVVRFLFCW